MHSSFAVRFGSAAFGASLLLMAAASAEAQQLDATVTLDSSSPTFALPLSCGVAGSSRPYFKSVDFQVSVDGSYTIATVGNDGVQDHVDPLVVFYDATAVDFDTAEACTDWVDDSLPPSTEATVTTGQLVTGKTYTAIFTTAFEGATGLIQYSISGPGTVSAIPAINKVAVTSDPSLTSATLIVQLGTTALLHYVVVPAGAPAPTAPQISVGHNAADGNAIASGDMGNIAPDSDATIVIQGLMANTQYDLYAVTDLMPGFGGIRMAIFKTEASIDTAPDPIVFVPQYGVPLDSICTSNTVTLTGINMSVPISITGGYYAIDWDGTIEDNDDITNQNASVGAGHTITAFIMNTAAQTATTTTATVTIGSDTYPFSCTTQPTNRIIIGDPFTGEQGNCPNGGVDITVGDDKNGNGQLDGGEPSNTFQLCNASNVEVTSSTLSPNPSVCPRGGVHVNIGIPGSEITSTEPNLPPLTPPPPPPPVTTSFNLCNGLNSLVKTAALAEDDTECPNGGIAVTTWTDSDGDSALDQNEASLTQKVCNGIDGSDGTNGTNGHDSLIETTPLTSKANECPNGGFLVKTGTDVDDDQKLDEGEVRSTRKVCNALEAVSRTTEIASNATACTHGGKKIELGFDANGDKELNDDEVTSSAVVCNGDNLAVRTRDLEHGSDECPGGGTTFETGLDENGNGELDNNEVEKREVLCQPAAILFATEEVPVDEGECENGGLRLISGHDDGKPSGTAGNGTLEDDEIEASNVVCGASELHVSGGNTSCSVTTPGANGSSTALASTLVALVGIAWRRRRKSR